MVWSKIITHDFSNFSYFNVQGLAIQGGVAFTVLLWMIIINIFLSSKNFMIKNVYHSKQFLTKISSLLYFDATIPTILIAQAIGR
jgi:prolipoprotein diacylglyceryltransferase